MSRTLLMLCLLALAERAVAQRPLDGEGQRRVTVAVYLGGSSGGPARDVEAAMVAGGYTVPFGGCDFLLCVPETPSPSSYSHANPLALSVSYRLHARYAVELLIGQGASGTVSGRREDEQLLIEYGGTFVAPLVSLQLGRAHVGLGPALLRGAWTYSNSSDGREARERTNALGWIGSAAVEIPIRSRLALRATGQYRGFGTTTVRGRRCGGVGTALPSARVRGTHSYFAGGVAVRL